MTKQANRYRIAMAGAEWQGPDLSAHGGQRGSKTEQGDLWQALGASQGDFERFVVAPTSALDSFNTMPELFNLCDRHQCPAIVITDLLMPEKDGLETISELKKDYPDTKFIAITGGGRVSITHLMTIARQLGADHVITKPFGVDEVLDCVKECLAS